MRVVDPSDRFHGEDRDTLAAYVDSTQDTDQSTSTEKVQKAGGCHYDKSPVVKQRLEPL